MPIKPNKQYTSNLAALRRFLPDLAAQVEAEPIPQHIRLATGRDGSATFRLQGEDGDEVWFGGSSMPTISAPGWLSGFASDGGHVLLPGIHTGLEPLVLADRVPAHAAVLVAEPSLLAVKLAFHLYDYVELLHVRRLVFVNGLSPADGIRALAESHPGFDLPTQLVPSPEWRESDVRAYQQQLAEAGDALQEVQARELSRYQQYASARGARAMPETPAVAVLSLDPSFLTAEEGSRIVRGAAALGWRHASCLPCAPDRGNVVARLRAVRDVDADLALFINSTAGHFGGVADTALPIAFWFPSAAVTDTVDTDDAGRACRWFAGSRTIADSLIAAGVLSDFVRMLAPGADPMCAVDEEPVGEDFRASGCPVALIGDLPDDTPESAGIGLTSHVRLWRALQDECRDRADDYEDSQADTMVRAAQDRSGVNLQDDDLRARFATQLTQRIAPAYMARAALNVVRDCQVPFRAWGSHWRMDDGEDILSPAAPIPYGRDRRAMLADAVLVVLPTVGPEAVQAALDALAMGRRVAWRWTRDAFDREYPALSEVSSFVHFYQTRDALKVLVAELTSAPAGVRASDREAMELVRGKHGVIHRLRILVEAFRQGRT